MHTNALGLGRKEYGAANVAFGLFCRHATLKPTETDQIAFIRIFKLKNSKKITRLL
jgi:hypothetical protein